MQVQTEKAIATTVDAKLKSAEEREVVELANAVASVTAHARPPMKAVRCGSERDACVECYRQFGSADPLKCAPLVDALESCASSATRSLIWKSLQ